jgi:hypothetical protein
MNNKNDVDKMLENSQSKTFMSNMKISQDLKDHFYVVEIGLPLLKLPFLPEKGGLPLLERSLLLDRQHPLYRKGHILLSRNFSRQVDLN